MRDMLQIYRRHLSDCKHREKGRAYHKCACPIWIDNGLSGAARIRHSLKTTVWTKANEDLIDMERGVKRREGNVVAVAAAAEKYLLDCSGRHLAPPTLRKIRSQLVGSSIERMECFRKAAALVEWAKENGVRVMRDWSQERMEAYRGSWKDAPLSAAKRLDLLRSFFGWAVEHELCPVNYAAKLRRPVPRPVPTLPYSTDEFQRLLDACLVPSGNEPAAGAVNRARLRTLLLVMRYTGLRISDALTLTNERIAGGLVRLHQHKTSQWVHIPLPGWLAVNLAATPKAGPAYWFVAPGQSVKNAHEHWRRKLAIVAERAQVENPGFHRIRDTFAVELLLAGHLLEEVSVLLGHKSIKMTERFYAPWVCERQVGLDARVLATWESDPVAQREKLFLGGSGDAAVRI